MEIQIKATQEHKNNFVGKSALLYFTLLTYNRHIIYYLFNRTIHIIQLEHEACDW